MKNIQTTKKLFKAEELLKTMLAVNDCNVVYDKRGLKLINKCMTVFAKLHVEAALKAASNKAEATLESSGDEEYPIVIKDSILNSYSLEKIK